MRVNYGNPESRDYKSPCKYSKYKQITTKAIEPKHGSAKTVSLTQLSSEHT